MVDEPLDANSAIQRANQEDRVQVAHAGTREDDVITDVRQCIERNPVERLESGGAAAAPNKYKQHQDGEAENEYAQITQLAVIAGRERPDGEHVAEVVERLDHAADFGSGEDYEIGDERNCRVDRFAVPRLDRHTTA